MSHKRMIAAILAVVTVFVCTAVLAKDNPMGIAEKQTINFSQPTVVGGTLLPAADANGIALVRARPGKGAYIDIEPARNYVVASPRTDSDVGIAVHIVVSGPVTQINIAAARCVVEGALLAYKYILNSRGCVHAGDGANNDAIAPGGIAHGRPITCEDVLRSLAGDGIRSRAKSQKEVLVSGSARAQDGLAADLIALAGIDRAIDVQLGDGGGGAHADEAAAVLI